jgi:hypothetical protein
VTLCRWAKLLATRPPLHKMIHQLKVSLASRPLSRINRSLLRSIGEGIKVQNEFLLSFHHFWWLRTWPRLLSIKKNYLSWMMNKLKKMITSWRLRGDHLTRIQVLSWEQQPQLSTILVFLEIRSNRRIVRETTKRI